MSRFRKASWGVAYFTLGLKWAAPTCRRLTRSIASGIYHPCLTHRGKLLFFLCLTTQHAVSQPRARCPQIVFQHHYFYFGGRRENQRLVTQHRIDYKNVLRRLAHRNIFHLLISNYAQCCKQAPNRFMKKTYGVISFTVGLGCGSSGLPHHSPVVAKSCDL